MVISEASFWVGCRMRNIHNLSGKGCDQETLTPCPP
jgi:hypothetical protein